MDFYLYDMEVKKWWKAKQNGFTKDVRKAGVYPETQAEYLAILANKNSGTLSKPRTVLIPVESYPKSPH